MTKPKFVSVHRKFTTEEKRRFEAGKKWAKKHHAELNREAVEAFAKMEATFAAMQMLKQEREARGLSLTEVAERSGIDKSNLSKLENDRNANPTLDTLVRIARAIGVKLTIGLAAA